MTYKIINDLKQKTLKDCVTTRDMTFDDREAAEKFASNYARSLQLDNLWKRPGHKARFTTFSVVEA